MDSDSIVEARSSWKNTSPCSGGSPLLEKVSLKSEVVIDETDLSKHKPKVQDPLKSFYEDRVIYELPKIEKNNQSQVAGEDGNLTFYKVSKFI